MRLFKRTGERTDLSENSLFSSAALGFALQGFSEDEANRMAEEVIERATDESLAAGGGHPPGYGDELVRRAQAGDPGVLARFHALRADGVTEDDIRWYWNQSDIQIRVVELIMDQARMAHFIHALEELAEENPGSDLQALAKPAGARVRRFHPMFGDPSDASQASGEDRPLQAELKDRIDRYVEKAFLEERSMRQEILGFTSFNALVRARMRSGDL